MEGSREWGSVLRQAQRALRRYGDATTRDAYEDIAQEASLLTWQWAGQLADHERLHAAVRTITKRHRTRWLSADEKRRWLRYVHFASSDRDELEAAKTSVCEPPVSDVDDDLLSIDGRPVPMPWARRRLGRVLGSLSRLDQKLLLGFHEGFCCAELASRFGRTEDCIKTRICRARKRVRSVFEDLVRSAGDLDEPEFEEERS